ncbi:unnamed protein product [Heterotrigona itama]|uniref:HAT C-terminal dimerisation domain-containing protein n=1 Tax=Heterotrigona itama TaxID=395501 RepID=A0A6V7GTB4_9HYME|nr:unnamed protein product [Heterotrigona itama]
MIFNCCVKMKEYPFPQFEDKEWICDFAFLVDITRHLNDLNIKLQGKSQFIHNMFDKINAFESKFKIWNKHLLSDNTRGKSPDKLQMELIDLQNDTRRHLGNKFQNVDIHNFYQNYMNLEKFPRLGAYTKQIMTLFGSTYVCEQLFSAMKIIRSDHRSRLNDIRLESCVRVAVSSISANIDHLMTKKQCQISH